MRRQTLLSGLGAALAAPLPELRGANADTATVQIGNVPFDSTSEMLSAESQGFLSKAGIAAEIQNFSNGNTVASALLAGALDIGGINTLSLATAHQKGLPLKILASGAMYTTKNPTTALLVAADSQLRSARDLNGKTVAVNVLQGTSHISALLWIRKNGGNEKTVKFTEMPTVTMTAALSANRIDAAVVAEPQLTEARGETRLLGKSFDGIADLWMIDGWVATDAWIAANQTTARKFGDAMRQASAWANRNHDKTAELVSAATKIDLRLVLAMHRATFLEHANLNAVQPVIDAAVQYGVLTGGFSASELFDPTALH